MNKRGIAPEFTTSLLITLIVLVLVFFIGNRVLQARDCPAGYDVVNDFSDLQISSFCGTQENLIENNQRCCRRKSNDVELCLWDKDEKDYVKCSRLTKFNFQNVCEDNTHCGSSTSDCSGAYCKEGICLVENGLGKCAKEFILEGRKFGIDENQLCEGGLKVDVAGGKCDGTRHCIFDPLTKSGTCRGGYSGLTVDEAKDICIKLCDKAVEQFSPGEYFKSTFCRRDPLPVLVGGKNTAVSKTCTELLSREECSVTCSTISGASPPEE